MIHDQRPRAASVSSLCSALGLGAEFATGFQYDVQTEFAPWHGRKILMAAVANSFAFKFFSSLLGERRLSDKLLLIEEWDQVGQSRVKRSSAPLP